VGGVAPATLMQKDWSLIVVKRDSIFSGSEKIFSGTNPMFSR